MIAGYPEPDYATMHNDVLRSLNNCHRLDWIHYRAMAYYDRQAAQSAWTLYQSTNAIMFERGLKICGEEEAETAKDSAPEVNVQWILFLPFFLELDILSFSKSLVILS